MSNSYSPITNDVLVKKIIQEIADKYEIPYFVADSIWQSQFKFLRNYIKNIGNINDLEFEDFKIVMLPKLGKFFPGPAKVKYYKTKAKNKLINQKDDNSKEND